MSIQIKMKIHPKEHKASFSSFFVFFVVACHCPNSANNAPASS